MLAVKNVMQYLKVNTYIFLGLDIIRVYSSQPTTIIPLLFMLLLVLSQKIGLPLFCRVAWGTKLRLGSSFLTSTFENGLEHYLTKSAKLFYILRLFGRLKGFKHVDIFLKARLQITQFIFETTNGQE